MCDQSMTTENRDCGTTAACAVRLTVAKVAKATTRATVQRQAVFAAEAERRNVSTSVTAARTIRAIQTLPL